MSKDIHKAMQNIVFNELELSPEKVERMLREAIERRISELFASKSMQTIIEEQVARTLDGLVKKNRQDWQAIRGIVADAAEKHVREHLVISFK